MEGWLRLFAKTYERDKIGKIIQYTYKYYSWKAMNTGDSEQSKRFAKISSQISLARKLTRLGRSLEEWIKLKKLMEQSGALSATQVCAVSSSALMGFYYIFDHIVWAGKLDIYQTMDIKKANKYRVFFWFLATAVNMYPALLRSYEAHLSSSSSDADSTRKSDLTLLKRSCDLVVSTSNAIQVQAIPAYFATHNGIIGLAGMTSGVSALFMSSVW